MADQLISDDVSKNLQAGLNKPKEAALAAGKPAESQAEQITGGATVSDSRAVSADSDSKAIKQLGTFPPPLPLPTTPKTITGNWHAILVNGQTVFQSGSAIVSGDVVLSGGGTLFVDSGAVVSGFATGGGANRIIINSGGTLESSYVSGGYVYVSSGGVTKGNQYDWDNLYVSSGGTSIDDAYFASGHAAAPARIYDGGVVIDPQIYENGKIFVSGGTVSGGNVDTGGSIWVGSSGTADDVNVSPGGTADINGTVSGGGIIPVEPGPLPDTAPVLKGTWYARNINGETVYQSGDVSVKGPVTFRGSKLYIEGGAVVSGLVNDTSYANIYIESGGTLMNSTLRNGWVYLSGGGTSMYNYINSDPYIIYSGGVSINDVLYNNVEVNDKLSVLSGGTIIDPIVSKGGVISVYSGGTMIDPSVSPGGSIYVNGGGSEACFLLGTKIATPFGDVAVENLRVGDTVLAHEAAKTEHVIKWIGQKNASVPIHDLNREDAAKYPVRVVKNAFGPNCPNADLLVTEEHCVAIDGKLHPIRMLVNGKSIFYDTDIESYTYFHIETDVHCILSANGAPFESYLNTSNYHGFRVDDALKVSASAAPKSWDQDAALPLSVERPVVESLYNSLLIRAQEEGFLSDGEQKQFVHEHGLHLLLPTKEKVGPHRIVDGTYFFSFSSEHDVVLLASRSGRASDVIGPFVDDRRNLGVLIDRITITDREGRRDVTSFLEHDALAGWHGLENGPHRWTNGHAKLPLPEIAGEKQIITLEIHVAHSGPYLLETKKDSALT